MPTKPVKKRNSADATLRNVRAARKRALALTSRVAQLELNQEYFKGEIAALKRQAGK